MKFVNRADAERSAANPSNAALGFDLEDALNAALKLACKPIAARLRQYQSDEAAIQAKLNRWYDEAYQAKLNQISEAAHRGDAEAAAAIEAGQMPSRESYKQMHAKACAELEAFRVNGRGLFAEAAELVRPAMDAVVDRAQAVLDKVCSDFGLPVFQMTGARNGVGFLIGNLERVARNESGDASPFWGRFNS